MKDYNEKTEKRLQKAPIPSLILSFALPSAVSMLVLSLYSLADSYFVSSISPDAGAAVAAMFAMQVLLQTVGYTLGMGGGSLLSRALGRGERERALRYAAASLLGAVLAGTLITALSLVFEKRLIFFLGVDESIYQSAKEYATPLFWSAVPTCMEFVLTHLLRAEGKVVIAMWGQVIGCSLNALLDPLLIHTLGLGLAGASTATLIAQSAVTVFLLSFYLQKRTRITLIQSLGFSTLKELPEILFAGMPSLLRQGLSGGATILFNHAAKGYGASAVTAFSTVNRLFLFAFALCLGFGQGLMPVAGYQFGAGNTQRAKQAYRFSALAATFSMAAISIPIYFFAPQLIAIFSGEEEVISLGARAIRLLSLVLFSHGAVTCTIMYLQAIGKSLAGTLLASARQGIFFLPLLFLLPAKWGLEGLILTQPAADAATLLFAIPFIFYALRVGERKIQ